jgi:predicted MFS family arabinose efflux permease
MIADGARACVVGLLCVVIATGNIDIRVVLLAMFLLGVAEVFADTTSATLLPMLVDKADLGIGNARFMASSLVANQIVGPPLGALLFAVGMVWPFATQAVCVGLGVVLVARVATPKGGVRDGPKTHILRDIAEGVRWMFAHAAVRTLALVIFVFNVTWGAGWSVLVLYSLDHLHMGEVGFGLLTTAAAVGGLIGTGAYGWIERHVALSTVMRTCLLLEVLTHLSLALTTSGWVAALVMVGFGAYAFVWATVSQTVRQRVVPTEMQGRVGSVYMVALVGGLVIGQAIGGGLAEVWGLTAPFWFAFVGSAITLAMVWRQLDHIAHAQPS